MTRLDTLRTRLRTQLGNVDIVAVPNAVLDDAINSAHTFILDRYQHLSSKSWFSFNTTSAVTNYAIPTNYGVVLKVFDTVQGCGIRKANSADVPSLSALATGRPRWYIRDGSFLTLFPTPSAVYKIGVYAVVKISPIVTDGDLTLVDATWDDGLLKRARYEYYDTYQDVTKAQIALASFTEWVSTKPEVEAEETRDLDRGIGAPPRANEAREFNSGGSQFRPGQAWFNERFPE